MCIWNEKLNTWMRVLPNGKWMWNGNVNVSGIENMRVLCAHTHTHIMLLMREISTIIIQIIGQNAHHLCSQIPITRHKLTFVFKTLQSMSMKWLSFKTEFRQIAITCRTYTVRTIRTQNRTQLSFFGALVLNSVLAIYPQKSFKRFYLLQREPTEIANEPYAKCVRAFLWM